jgi:hypothetical protein
MAAGPGTVPDMFRRHRTRPTHDISSVALAFHGRLAGLLAAPAIDRPAVDGPEARTRLAAPASPGLRDRIERRFSA